MCVLCSRSELFDKKLYLFLDASWASLIIECSTKERSGIIRETIGRAIENIAVVSVSVCVYIVERGLLGCGKKSGKKREGDVRGIVKQ